MRLKLFLLFLAILAAGCDTGLLPTGPGATSAPKYLLSSDMHGNSRSEGAFHCGHGMQHHYSEMYINRDTGGVLSFFDGTLSVPPHSINESKLIWAKTYMFHGPPPEPRNSGRDQRVFKQYFEFGPSETTFDPPAQLTLSYCQMPPVDVETLVLRYFNEETQTWEFAGFMTHNPGTKSFSGPIYHFSRYTLSANGQVIQPRR